MTETALDIKARINSKRREQAYLYAQLEMWASVKDQGIDIDTVDKFGYSEKHHTREDKRKADLEWRRSQSNPFVCRMPNGSFKLLFYNYVKHHDGTITVLNPMVKAPHEDDF